MASFQLEREFDSDMLRDGINGNLDRDIRVLDCDPVDPDFHARFSSKAKTYRYRICTSAIVSPFDYRFVHHYRGDLDVAEMNAAASMLQGRHDFSAFTVLNNDSEDLVRMMMRLEVTEADREIHVTAQADGFLRFMVRAIVGTLIDVGRGRRLAAEMEGILSSRNRSMAGATAPARGLTLIRVDY